MPQSKRHAKSRKRYQKKVVKAQKWARKKVHQDQEASVPEGYVFIGEDLHKRV